MADISLDDVNAYLAQKQAIQANPGASAAMAQPPPPQAPSQGPTLEEVNKYLAAKQGKPMPTSTPGSLESFGRGLEQGATLDFAPRINAGVQSAVGALMDKPVDYDEALKNEQAAMQKAQAAHPYLYGAGNVAGFAAPMAIPGVGEALGAGEGILGAAKTGATLGAISGVGNSQDLTNTGDVAKNAIQGGLVGGVTGGAMGTAQEALTPFLKQAGSLSSRAYNAVSGIGPFPTAAKAFGEGLNGNFLWGEQPHTEATRDLLQKLSGSGDVIQDALNSASKEQTSALTGQTPSVDISDWVQNAIQAGQNAKKFTSFGDNRQAIDQVLAPIEEFVQQRGTMVTPQQANELKQQLGLLGTEGEDAMTNPFGRQFANRLISPLKRSPNATETAFGLPEDFSSLKDVLNNAVDGLDPANQRISKLLMARDMIPSLNTLAQSERPTNAGAIASDKLDDFFSTLPEDVRQQIQPDLEAAVKTKTVADRINAGGLNHGPLSIAETGRGALWGMANSAGTGLNAIGQAAKDTATDYSQGTIGSLFKSMYNQSPETFNSVGQQMVGLGGTAADIGKALVGASQKDNFGRNAIIFALSQNPAYRDTIEKHFGNGVGINMTTNPADSKISQHENTSF